ncbi:MAG TPA: TonB-dependent receptor [Polyangiaceae bacterium]|nr:TonB-dependent receptor [Polyangiaceae bacterium]
MVSVRSLLAGVLLSSSACLSSGRVWAQSSLGPAARSTAPKPVLTRPPEILEFVDAEYPESEKAQGRAASVVLELAISPLGTVDAARVVESAGIAFDEAALAAARRFRFTPAEIDGRPAPVRIRYRYDFVLREQVPSFGKLTGVVRDKKKGTPLAGVTVQLSGQPSVTTDAAGRFEYAEVEPGTYTLSFSRADLRGLQTSESIEAGRSLEAIYEVEQAPSEPEAAEDSDDLEIVVVAPRLTKQVVSTRVGAEEAQRVAGTQGDVLKVVENLPGVTRATAGSGQLVVWGAAPGDTRVIVDGVDLPALYHYGGVRSVMHGDLVRSVELLPGGYGAAFGRGTGGLVRVESQELALERLRGSAQLDVLDASAALRGPLNNRVQASASARKSHLGWLLNRVTSKDLGDFFPIPQYADGSARVRLAIGDGEWLELSGLASWDRVTRSIASEDPLDRRSQTRQLNFQRVFLRYQREPGDGTRVVILPWVGADQRDLVAQFSSVASALHSRSSIVGLRASYEGRIDSTLSGTLGFDLQLVSTEVRRTGSIGTPAREGDAFVFGQAPPDRSNSDTWRVLQGSAAPYVEADWAPWGERFHIVPGLRLEPTFQSVPRRQPQEGSHPGVGVYRSDVVLEPRISLRYSPTTRASFRAAVGRYHQAATPEDLSAVFGNPLLGPSDATHWLAGVNVRVASGLSLETTAFYTRTEQIAVRNPIDSPLVAQALLDNGQGRAFGAQFLLRREATNGFMGWAAYTILRSERRDDPSGDWRLFDYDQTHVFTGVASYELGAGFDVGLRLRYATGYPRTPVLGAYEDTRRGIFQPIVGARNGSRIPDFIQLDARLARRQRLAGGDLELYADVQNVTDRDNPEEIAYSPDFSARRYILGLPILPVVGARWSF